MKLYRAAAKDATSCLLPTKPVTEATLPVHMEEDPAQPSEAETPKREAAEIEDDSTAGPPAAKVARTETHEVSLLPALPKAKVPEPPEPYGAKVKLADVIDQSDDGYFHTLPPRKSWLCASAIATPYATTRLTQNARRRISCRAWSID